MDSVFPFYADTWGTVSDWLMLVITFFGTLYIVRSFRAQKTINAQQSEINSTLGNSRYVIFQTIQEFESLVTTEIFT